MRKRVRADGLRRGNPLLNGCGSVGWWLLLAGVALPGACKRADSTDGRRETASATDRLVAPDRLVGSDGAPFVRIITIAPNSAEILCAIGACDSLVGISTFCVYPPRLLDRPRVGGLFDTDLEKIISLRPDLVVLRGRNEAVQRLCLAGNIAVYHDPTERIADVQTCIRELGERVGREEQAAALILRFQRQIDAVVARVARIMGDAPRPKVLVTLARNPQELADVFTAGPQTYINDLLEIAGGENLFGHVDMDYPTISMEDVLTRQPDVILELMPEVSIDDARAKLGSEPGIERMLDLMLRSGPYGDAFDDAAPGLNLAKVRAVDHAIDLGPLTQRLPEIIRKHHGRLKLVHEILEKDIERLRRGLAERSDPDRLVLVGRRQLRNMNTWLHNLENLAKGPERCTLLVNPIDAERLGISDGGTAKVTARAGSVTAPVTVSDEMMPGVVSLPHGFGHRESDTRQSVASSKQPGANANQLLDEFSLDVPSNTSVANGIVVQISPA